jgi:hypothetical protein
MKVPLVVLNACRSGAAQIEATAGIATSLMAHGAAAVVAMQYTIYADAAARFMKVFYRAALSGDSLFQAVTRGRLCLHDENMRPSVKGLQPLDDWIVPVIYARRDFPLSPRRDTMDIGIYTSFAEGNALEPAIPPSKTPRFLGRDDVFFKLELALPSKHVVVVHGSGGMGKTELAKAFGRWWQRTGALDRDSWLFFYSFEPGAAPSNLDGILNEIGRRLPGGEKLNEIPLDKRAAFVTEMLRRHRALLIWDNFETAHSMPSTELGPLYSQKELAKFKDFVSKIAGAAKSSILITSRNAESWLGNVHRVPLHGLKEAEAAELADNILSPYANGRTRRDVKLKLPRFRGVVLDLGDYGSVVTASIAAS